MGIQQQHRVVLITGGGSGLGAAAAKAFAKEGAAVVLCGRRKGRVEAVAAEIAGSGGIAWGVQADVSVPEEVEQLVRETVRRFGRVDVLVNNAATFEAGSVTELSFESWSRQLAINLNGVFLATRACLPIMRGQKSGRILNITSGLASNGAGGFAAYAASKAGVESLTRTVADDEAAGGIACAMYNPGAIKTEMHAIGDDPTAAASELVRLAGLPADALNGRLFERGD